MPDFHYFQPEIAAKYGVNAAILLQNFAFWIDKNKANGKHFHDGLYWTYNSIKAFEQLFPYMSAKAVRTAIQKLVDEGLVKTGNFNSSAYDRTTWYAVTEKGASILQNGNFHLPKTANGFTEKGEPIPDNKPYRNTNNKPDREAETLNPTENPFQGELADAYSSWLEYKKERRQSYKPTGLRALITQISNAAAQYGDSAVADIISASMANGYSGIIFDQLKQQVGGSSGYNGNPKPFNGEPSEYNITGIELDP